MLYADLPESYQNRNVGLTSNETGRRVSRPLHKVLQERYAEITAMDRAIGRLRQYLRDNGLRQDTLLWYCGDNGIPSSGRATTPFRGLKGLVYEGGIRVPGIIEWPAQITHQRVTDVNAVTTDMLPTICDLVGKPLPERPLDGISLKPLINGNMSERPRPICFWNYNAGRESNRGLVAYIDPKLQAGTTPTVKLMAGRLTRDFRNVHHPKISEQDYSGPRAILDNRYKLVVDGQPQTGSGHELFDLRNDPAEKHNLIEAKPDVAKNLERQLRNWQQSVLNSLTGADYR